MAGNFVPSGVELIAQNLGKFLSDLNTANKAIENLGNKSSISASVLPGFQGLGNAILDIGAKATAAAVGGIAALGAGVAAVAAKGTVMAADLEQGIANIAATSNKTVKEIQPLKDLIQTLALDPNLKVTTDEATQAIQALTKQGLDMTTIIEGAGKATVALSNATGGDFGTAASLTAGVMKAFNIQAKDLSTVIDGITGVTTNSKFTVDDYALAFAQAGAVAANLGVDLKDFNAVIASTASSFSSGSDAGTSFKTLLLRLSAPTDEMKDVMKKYGISLFDAEGKMRSMSDIVGQLNTVLQGNVTVTETVGGATKKQAAAAEQAAKALPQLTHSVEAQSNKLKLLNDTYALTVQYYGEGSPKARSLKLQIDDLSFSLGQNQSKLEEANAAIALVNSNQAKQVTSTKQLTEAERAKIAEALGGADASRLILALSKSSQAEFDKLTGKVNAQGSAFKSSATRMATAKGALEILQGVLEAVQIQIGEQFLPIVTQIAKAMSEWASVNGPQVVAFFGQISDAINTTIAVGMKLFSAFQQGGLAFFSTAFGTEGIFLWAQIKVLIDNVSTAIGNLGTAVSAFLPDLTQLSSGGIIASVTEAIKYLNDNFTAFAGALGGIVTAGVIGVIVASIAALASPVLLVVAAAGALGAAWATNFLGIRDFTLAAWATLQPILTELVTWLGVNIPIAITAVSTFWTTTLQPAIMATANFISTVVIPVLSQLGNWFGTLLVADVTGFMEAWAIVSNGVTTNLADFSEAWVTTSGAVSLFVDFVNTSLTPLMFSINNFISAVFSKTLQAFAGLWQNILSPAIKAVGDYLVTTFQPSVQSVGKVVEEKVQPPVKSFSEQVLPKLQTGLKAVGDVIKDVTGFFNSLASAVSSFTLPEVLQRHSPSPFEQVLMGVATNADIATAAIVGIGEAGDITADRLDKLLGVQRGLASTNNVIGAAADYVEKYFDKVAQTAGSKTKFALRILKDVFKSNSQQILSAGDMKQQQAVFAKLAMGAVNWEKAGISGGAISGAVATFVKFFESEKDRLEKLQQEVFVKAGRNAVTLGKRLTDVIDASSDILDERVSVLQDLVASGQAQVEFEGRVISATEAQQLLNQALRDQQKVQEDLLVTQQNTAKLDFLGKQLDLLETINKAGLNAKDILGGLQLGLNASIPDIIEATNRLISAMVNQVNSDLQIHSPSAVMRNKGLQTGRGFAMGALESLPLVSSAFQRIASLSNALGPQRLTNYSSNSSNVNNYNFSMDVSTGSSPQAVIQQYAVMQAMVS